MKLLDTTLKNKVLKDMERILDENREALLKQIKKIWMRSTATIKLCTIVWLWTKRKWTR